MVCRNSCRVQWNNKVEEPNWNKLCTNWTAIFFLWTMCMKNLGQRKRSILTSLLINQPFIEMYSVNLELWLKTHTLKYDLMSFLTDFLILNWPSNEPTWLRLIAGFLYWLHATRSQKCFLMWVLVCHFTIIFEAWNSAHTCKLTYLWSSWFQASQRELNVKLLWKVIT